MTLPRCVIPGRFAVISHTSSMLEHWLALGVGASAHRLAQTQTCNWGPFLHAKTALCLHNKLAQLKKTAECRSPERTSVRSTRSISERLGFWEGRVMPESCECSGWQAQRSDQMTRPGPSTTLDRDVTAPKIPS